MYSSEKMVCEDEKDTECALFLKIPEIRTKLSVLYVLSYISTMFLNTL